jgi:hypothetical protein
MRSSDDTHFILTLDPIELSRAILASGGDLLRADRSRALSRKDIITRRFHRRAGVAAEAAATGFSTREGRRSRQR